MKLQYFNWGKQAAFTFDTESSGYHSKCTEKGYVKDRNCVINVKKKEDNLKQN